MLTYAVRMTYAEAYADFFRRSWCAAAGVPCMLTYAVRMLTYAVRMLTYAQVRAGGCTFVLSSLLLTYAVRMLTYADVC